MSRVKTPALVADPAWRSGEVCMAASPRIPAELVASLCLSHGPDEVRANWAELSDRDILVACWWTITREWVRRGDRRTRLGKWAHGAGEMLWNGNLDELPDFPPLTPGFSTGNGSGWS